MAGFGGMSLPMIIGASSFHDRRPKVTRGLALAKPPAAVGNASASDMFRIVAPASTSAVAAPAGGGGGGGGGGAGGWASASSSSPLWFTTDPTRGEVGVNRRLPAVLYQVVRSEGGGGGGSAERHEEASDPLSRSAPIRQALVRQSSGGAAQLPGGCRQNVLLRGSSHPHGRLKAVANRQVLQPTPIVVFAPPHAQPNSTVIYSGSSSGPVMASKSHDGGGGSGGGGGSKGGAFTIEGVPSGPGHARRQSVGGEERAGDGPPSEEGSPPPERDNSLQGDVCGGRTSGGGGDGGGSVPPGGVGEEVGGVAKVGTSSAAGAAGGRPRRPWHVEGAQQPQRQVPAKKAGGGGGASGGGKAIGNGGSSPSKKDMMGGAVPGKGACLAGEGDKGRPKRGELVMNKLKEPVQKTNSLGVLGGYVGPTDEEVMRAKKETARSLRGTQEERDAHEAMMSTFRSRRGMDDDTEVYALLGGNRAMRNALENKGFEEVPEQDLDTAHFDVRWTLTHDDINFSTLSPPQIVNHYPNSGAELGAKVGLHRNIRGLAWLDGVDTDRFYPRMYTLSNPGEMQDFIDDFIFVAAHSELTRRSRGEPVSCSEARGDAAAERGILEHAACVCNRFLDNRKAAETFEHDPNGVLDVDDFFLLRPDMVAKYRSEGRARRAGGVGWACLSDEEVSAKVEAALSRVKREHTQYGMDGTRNVWIVKPGYGSRGRGIKCFNDLEAIISYATGRKRAAIVQKYVETCLTLGEAPGGGKGRKFDIRCWVLVTNWNPLTVWTYEGYVRLCTNEHSLEAETLSNQYAHLCNRCVQDKGGSYNSGADGGTGSMWSVGATRNYLSTQKYPGFEGMSGDDLWDRIEGQLRQLSTYAVHSAQESIDNKPGCIEWFGIDFMVDTNFDCWMLECNISPDLSTGTRVLDRLVPEAMRDMWDLVLPEGSPGSSDNNWKLAFHGKHIKSEVMQKRYWLKKTLLSELRAGRPYSMRDALQLKIGSLTNTFLSARGQGANKKGNWGKLRAVVKKKAVKKESSSGEESEESGED